MSKWKNPSPGVYQYGTTLMFTVQKNRCKSYTITQELLGCRPSLVVTRNQPLEEVKTYVEGLYAVARRQIDSFEDEMDGNPKRGGWHW